MQDIMRHIQMLLVSEFGRFRFTPYFVTISAQIKIPPPHAHCAESARTVVFG